MEKDSNGSRSSHVTHFCTFSSGGKNNFWPMMASLWQRWRLPHLWSCIAPQPSDLPSLLSFPSFGASHGCAAPYLPTARSLAPFLSPLLNGYAMDIAVACQQLAITLDMRGSGSGHCMKCPLPTVYCTGRCPCIARCRGSCGQQATLPALWIPTFVA